MERYLFVLCILYIIYLFYEKKNLEKNLKQFIYIIHVNGIRGKSTVTRMIDAGLRKGNYRVFSKITGTSPRIINTQNNEVEISRLGKANIKEQIEIINIAAKEKADVLVLECMAVDPILQKLCERQILKSNIGVITNVRMDHLDQMGGTLEEIAASLSSTIPSNGVLFTGDKKFYDYFEKIGKEKGTKVILGDDFPISKNKLDFQENFSIVYSLCHYLGIKQELILESFGEYKRDPGSLKIYSYKNNLGNDILFINAMAANDPDSSQIILNKVKEKYNNIDKKILLVNNRIDRISRMEQYIEFVLRNEYYFDKIYISGNVKKVFEKKLKKKSILSVNIEILENIDVFDKLDEKSIIIAVGNICGHGKTLVEKISQKGEITYAV